MIGGSITTVTAGGGNVYDVYLRQTNSRATMIGAIYDSAKLSEATANSVIEVAYEVNATLTDTTAIKAVTDVLPDSGALTTIGTDTARLTAVRAAVLTDWIDAGRLDAILDLILEDTGTTIPGTITTMQGNVTDILAEIGTGIQLDGGTATLAGMLTKMADDNAGADFDATDDSLTGISTGAAGGDATEAKQDELIATLGVAGLGLSDLGGMSTGMKAEVNAEADTAITDAKLDKLIVSSGAVETSGSNSTTQVQTDLAEATDNHYNNGVILITSGVEAGQTRRIVDFVGSTGVISWTQASTGTPADAVTFVILPGWRVDLTAVNSATVVGDGGTTQAWGPE